MFDIHYFIEKIKCDVENANDDMNYHAGKLSAYMDTLDYIEKNGIDEYDDMIKFFSKTHNEFHEFVRPNYIKGYYSGFADALNTLLTFNKEEDE